MIKYWINVLFSCMVWVFITLAVVGAIMFPNEMTQLITDAINVSSALYDWFTNL
jgi:hypothetical protein